MASSFITGVAAGDMSRTFANDGVVVMASHTGCSTDNTVIKVRRYKRDGTMTELTTVTAGFNMLPDGFTNNRAAVMAADTGGGKE